MSFLVAFITLCLAASVSQVSSADPGDNGSCLNLTLPDVAGLGKCLQNTLVTCGTSQTPIQALEPILTCVFKILRQKGSLISALKSFANIIAVLLEAANSQLASLFTAAINILTGTVTLTGCEGTIIASLPNTLVGKCATNLGNLCQTSASNLTPGLVSGLLCLVNNAVNTSPAGTVTTVLCDVLNLGDVVGGIPSTPLDKIIDRIKKELCA
ncbi:uncharacterized protein LOC144142219 [Haemaphysalis longicornis]